MRLDRQQLVDVAILAIGLVLSFVIMSIHHPYTATILSMVAAVAVAAHILNTARHAPR